MTSADVDLVEVTNATIAGGHSDVFELDIHVVFGCGGSNVSDLADARITEGSRASGKRLGRDGRSRNGRYTFDQFAPVDLPRGDFEGNNMILIEKLLR